MPSPYSKVISLGHGCQPAHQIRRISRAKEAHLFDWVLTSDEGLVQAIQSNLDGWFSKDSLFLNTKGVVEDRATGTRFIHEFPAGSDFDEQFAKNEGRITMLKGRWDTVMASGQRVLFVRQHAWAKDVSETATVLRDALRDKGPNLTFDLLYLTEPRDFDPAWQVKSVRFAPLPQPTPYDWRGDNAVWEALLSDIVPDQT